MTAEKTGQQWPDCDDDIRALVASVVDLSVASLGRNLAAVHLYGSLTTGAYHRPKSDLDFIVCVAEPLSDAVRGEIWHGLLALSDRRPTLGDIELSIITKATATRPVHPMPYELHFGENLKEAIRAGVMRHPELARDEDLAANFMTCQRRGVLLHGDQQQALGELSWQDYEASILEDFDWIAADKNILESPFYGVLNMCRILKVLVERPGIVPDKEEGAAWGLSNLPPEHHAIIAKALNAYRDPTMPAARTPEARRLGNTDWLAQPLFSFRDHAKSKVATILADR